MEKVFYLGLFYCIAIMGLAICFRINRVDPNFFRSLGMIFKKERSSIVMPFSVSSRNPILRRFEPSFSMVIGGPASDRLVRMTWSMIHDKARSAVLGGIEITREPTIVKYVEISRDDLGYRLEPSNLIDEKYCREWSKENLNDQEIKLCEPEDALWLRIQYPYQSVGGKRFAMKPILDMGKFPTILWIGKGESGRLFISAGWADSITCSHSLIFRLYELEKTPS